MNIRPQSSWMAMLLASVAVIGCEGGNPEVPDVPSAAAPDSSSAAGASSNSPAAAQGVTYERAKRVQKQRSQEIFHRYSRVQGVGITKVAGDLTAPAKHTDPVWGIIILVAAQPPGGKHSIDGVPLEFKVTGVFRPLGEPGR